jgi:hypothetical protein
MIWSAEQVQPHGHSQKMPKRISTILAFVVGFFGGLRNGTR